MIKTKKFLFLVLCFLFLSTFIFAKTETWIGITVDAVHDRPSAALKTQIVESGTDQFKKGSFTAFNMLGPSLEISFFPSTKLRLGLYGAMKFDFITGTDGARISNTFKDFKNGLRGGLALDLPFGSSMGIFTDIAFQYSWYRLALEYLKNSKEEYSTLVYTEPSIYADIGALARYKNWYFKWGFNFSKAIIQKDTTGFDISLFIAGGFIL